MRRSKRRCNAPRPAGSSKTGEGGRGGEGLEKVWGKDFNYWGYEGLGKLKAVGFRAWGRGFGQLRIQDACEAKAFGV